MSEQSRTVVLNGSEISCNMTAMSIILSGKWKPLILWQLVDDKQRFGQLKRNLVGISPRILSRELRELETHKIISRREFPSVPPKVEYQLTAVGEKIKPALDALCDWSERYMEVFAEKK